MSLRASGWPSKYSLGNFATMDDTLPVGNKHARPVGLHRSINAGPHMPGAGVAHGMGNRAMVAPGPTEPLLLNNAVVDAGSHAQFNAPSTARVIEETEWQGQAAFAFRTVAWAAGRPAR